MCMSLRMQGSGAARATRVAASIIGWCVWAQLVHCAMGYTRVHLRGDRRATSGERRGAVCLCVGAVLVYRILVLLTPHSSLLSA